MDYEEWKEEVRKEAKCLGLSKAEINADLEMCGDRHFEEKTHPFDFAIALQDALREQL